MGTESLTRTSTCSCTVCKTDECKNGCDIASGKCGRTVPEGQDFCDRCENGMCHFLAEPHPLFLNQQDLHERMEKHGITKTGELKQDKAVTYGIWVRRSKELDEWYEKNSFKGKTPEGRVPSHPSEDLTQAEKKSMGIAD